MPTHPIIGKNDVFSFSVQIPERGLSWTVNARNHGDAKHQCMSDVLEVLPDVQYTEFRSQKIGKPQTTEQFRRCAEYRGMPGLTCGQRVRVGDAMGVVVGHNASSNFDILFDKDSPRYPNLRLSVHPNSIDIL